MLPANNLLARSCRSQPGFRVLPDRLRFSSGLAATRPEGEMQDGSCISLAGSAKVCVAATVLYEGRWLPASELPTGIENLPFWIVTAAPPLILTLSVAPDGTFAVPVIGVPAVV